MLKDQAMYGRLKNSSLGSATLAFALTFGLFFPAAQARAAVAQSPLLLPSESVPGSLALVPSVEWPTILSVANLGNYSSAVNYTGYFDPTKCYLYKYDGTNADDTWFYPNGKAVDRKCNVGSAKKEWSGNFLNWAATPTIDPFRSALTGGQRYRDTAELTVLQKARHSGQSAAGNRIEDVQNNRQGILPQAEITGATPASSDWTNFHIRLQGLDYDMLFSNWRDGIGGGGSTGEKQREWVDYQPSLNAQFKNSRLITDYTPQGQVKSIYRVRLRVKVCDPSTDAGGVEANCKQYGSNYKPEGLLQQYAGTLRYSAFSYLNDSSNGRDGGVLRANQKYIGPTLGDGGTNNPNKEWSATTGVFVKNPNPDDATATGYGVVDSGVINYLNKFGSMSDRNHKSLDPVSELYYTAVRYFKHQGNIPSYSNLNDDTSENRYKTADGFPVITQWADPITYSCQKNVILGIGDVNTHRDKNLPGATSSAGEPEKPAEVIADTTVDVVTATAKVGALEGVDLKESANNYTGDRFNSAYIAGLAYDSHTKDLRPNISGKQTLSTYWVDVRENQALASKASNQYWLAAKYGGFTVPNNFQPYSTDTTGASITDAMWWTTGQYLSAGYKRPDNFFVASDAQNMVSSLKQAFAKIVQETRSSTTSLATNSTQLDTGSAVFQSLYNNAKWSGDLVAKAVSSNNTVASTSTWSAAAKLDALSAESSRMIFTSTALSGRSNNSYSTAIAAKEFTWSALDDDAKTLLKSSGAGNNSVDDTLGSDRVSYLRGNRAKERNQDNPTRPFRERASRLGDIVNSDPQFIHKQDFGYNLLSGSSWASAGTSYQTFRRTNAYQNRTPIIAVGANDGMLHIFNASLSSSGGSELFAYVPRNVLGSLYALTDPAYTHRYYVDGTPAFSDVWINSAWKTIVVGTTGAGGKSVFALDVTNPDSMGSSSVLWEFTAPDMAFPIQQPKIVALANGKFGVIVSSGFVNATVSTGQVWILDAANGSVIKKFSLTTSGGMGEPLAVDMNNDRVADRIYVGDTAGKLWRMDITDANPANWATPNAPIFTAVDGSDRAQSITAPLSAALNKDGSALVLFGTGSFYQVTDTDLLQNQRIESFYGLIDRNTPISRTDLQEQTIINERTAAGTNLGRAVSKTSLGDAKGWYLDLLWKQAQGGSNALTGERVVSRPVLRNGAVVFSTLTPSSDPCAGGGSSWVMALDVFSGSRLDQAFFDADSNGTLDGNDYYTDAAGNKIPYSGIKSPQYGAIKTPTFLEGNNDGSNAGGDDLICFSGSAGGEPFCSPTDPLARSLGRISWREVNR
ncbi:PilC/PilY family type IV pilus protein [Pseudomonas sp. G34]|uniref:pilus assembly protein n=1 Tax=Pseudomonas sp. G34 TaxID=3059083 RepID=UPI00280A3B8A|nr:PilC/PilY family type IV pilus protein [Pseudomonas sp. G34]MDQ7983361.1 PilC/PilY family type IV pilus protein [Pseudomonas sp. G34]